jgi:hypothetical protein
VDLGVVGVELAEAEGVLGVAGPQDGLPDGDIDVFTPGVDAGSGGGRQQGAVVEADGAVTSRARSRRSTSTASQAMDSVST